MVAGKEPPRRNSSFCSKLLRSRVMIALSPKSLVNVDPESYEPIDEHADADDSRRSAVAPPPPLPPPPPPVGE